MATPVTLTANGSPVTWTANGTPVSPVGPDNQSVAILSVGDTFETDDGGTVEIVAIENGAITSATYTAP